MEIVMPYYSVVCTIFLISLASLRVINPDFIALQQLPGYSHPPSLVTAQQRNEHACVQVEAAKMVSGQTSLINFGNNRPNTMCIISLLNKLNLCT